MTRPRMRIVEDTAAALLVTVLAIGVFVGACIAMAAGWTGR